MRGFFYQDWFGSRYRQVCRFEAPYESWKAEEPSRKRVVKRGRIFEFKLLPSGRSGGIATEAIECDDYFYNYNWRFSGLLKRADNEPYSDGLLHYASSPEASFLSEPLWTRYNSLYNGAASTEGNEACITAATNLWKKLSKDGTIPNTIREGENQYIHDLMNGVCLLNRQKQKKMIRAISFGLVKGHLIDPYAGENRATLTTLLGDYVRMEDFLEYKEHVG